MITPIKTNPISSRSTSDRRTRPVRAPETAQPNSDPPPRLIVETVPGLAEGYSYRLYDRATGALVTELNREDAEKLGASRDYKAGRVFDTKA